MTVYDFEIFYRSERSNSADDSSKRSNYEKMSFLNTKLLSTLQNKLTFSFDEFSQTINKRNKNNIFTFQLANVQTKIDDNETSSKNKRKMLKNFDSMFQLIDVQIVISKKKIKNISKISYDEFFRSMKSFIRKLQTNDI